MKDGMTSDGKHIDFGTGDSIPMPERFSAPDNASTCPGSWGHTSPVDDDSTDASTTNGY